MKSQNNSTPGVRHQSVTLGVYIKKEMLDEVRESAKSDNRSVSSWIINACREKLAREVSDTVKNMGV